MSFEEVWACLLRSTDSSSAFLYACLQGKRDSLQPQLTRIYILYWQTMKTHFSVIFPLLFCVTGNNANQHHCDEQVEQTHVVD